MFKFAIHLLLCAAVLTAQTPDLFKNCVPASGSVKAPQICVLIPHGELLRYVTYYWLLAESVLQKPSNQLEPKYVNAVYNLTRVAVKDRDVKEKATFRLEFTTSRSNCLHPRQYSAVTCLPIDDKVNGLCQAALHYRNGMFAIEQSWCKRMG
ncbi:uncharacterized protein LOC119168010 [Rhipicephalus microplus]|uniref:uncharacterized protein LOC119168010 n=1 Tax=Rhipicephalus microplus TaxID=6941 RepID=UPI003F6D6400